MPGYARRCAAYRHQHGQDAAGVAEDVPPMRCADRSWLPAKGALALAFDERIQKDLANVL
jgi:hypothetical protein